MSELGPKHRQPSDDVVGQPVSDRFGQLREQLRSYEAHPSLPQVYRRLEVSRRQPRVAPLVSTARAGALVAAGVLLGMWLQDQREPQFVATAEPGTGRLVPSAPAESAARQVQAESALAASERTQTQDQLARVAVARRSPPPVRPPAPGPDNNLETLENVLEFPELGPEPILPPVRPRWLLLADRGDFAGAFQQLDESDGFDDVLETGSADDLMTLADVARAMGRQGRAIQALRVVIERHQADPNAPLAAMVLGNLLSRAGDDRGAAQAFALNRRLAPGGDFAEDALVREFDMAVSGAHLDRAQQLAEQYGVEFPDGRHQEHVQGEIARLAEGVVAKSRGNGAEDKGSTEDSAKSEAPRASTEDARSAGSDEPRPDYSRQAGSDESHPDLPADDDESWSEF